MKLPEGALCEVILASSEVQALISGRLFEHPAPKNTAYPFVSYQRISTVPRLNLNGRSSLSGVRIQLNCYASRGPIVTEVLETLQNAIHGYNGIANGIEIKDISIDDGESGGGVDYDEKLDIFGGSFEAIVTYRRDQ